MAFVDYCYQRERYAIKEKKKTRLLYHCIEVTFEFFIMSEIIKETSIRYFCFSYMKTGVTVSRPVILEAKENTLMIQISGSTLLQATQMYPTVRLNLPPTVA